MLGCVEYSLIRLKFREIVFMLFEEKREKVMRNCVHIIPGKKRENDEKLSEC